MSKGRVLYFDYWTKGYRNFSRIDKNLKALGYETLLVHVESWIDPNAALEITLDSITTRDISYYKTNLVKTVLDIYKPKCVVLLNLSFVLDRAIVLECRRRDIRIVYLSHGKLTSIENLENIKNNRNNEIKGTLHQRISKKNMLMLMNYLISIRSISKAIDFIYRMIKFPAEYTVFPTFSDELLVNKCLVYYHNDYHLMTEKYKFPHSIVQVVGNPELDSFFNFIPRPREEVLSKLGLDTNQEYVLYLEDGLVQNKYWEKEKWYDFVIEINNLLIQQNLSLIVKLHPRSIGMYDDFFRQNRIIFFSDLDIENTIHHSNFIMSHFSSTIVYALILGKCVKSPRWGVSDGLIKNYPPSVISYYYNKEDFIKTLKETNVNFDQIQEYLNSIIGEVCGNSINRIVNEIDLCIK